MARLDLSAAMAKYAAKADAPVPAETKVIEAHIEPTPQPPPVDSKEHAPEPSMTIESNPFIVPVEQTLTHQTQAVASAPVAEDKHVGHVTPAGDLEIKSISELAGFDAEKAGLEPTDHAQRTDLLKATLLAKRMVLDSEEDVRALCDAIDSSIESFGDKLVGPGLITVRNYVQGLMVTLKARPEFDSVVIDKDIRNVMKFIRGVRGEALMARDVKEIKRETKKAKAAATPPKGLTSDAMANAFQQLMLNQMGTK